MIPAGAVSAWPGASCGHGWVSHQQRGWSPQEDRMHAVIRKYTATPDVMAEARPKLAHLEQTMRQTPGFVAYYFLETEDGVATITITEDEDGTTESMGRAANWVQQNLQNAASLGTPEVTRGQALI